MRPTYNNINNIDNNHRLNLLNNPYMSNTNTHLTPDDILTQDDLAELAIWESAQFNSNNIIHQHGFISLAAANQYPIFNYPTTINSIATRQPIFSVPPPTSSISRVAIPRSLIDNNNNHTTKKESGKSSSSNDVPKNISTNQKTLLPKPLQETLTSISSNNNNNNNSHGHGNESKNQSSSSSVIMSDDDNDDNGDDNDLRPVKQDQAEKLTADEDKRRRNTAASARFRVKKKLREKELERTAKEMTARTELLDERVKELEMENKWLRKLIVEKDAKLLSDVIDKNKDK